MNLIENLKLSIYYCKQMYSFLDNSYNFLIMYFERCFSITRREDFAQNVGGFTKIKVDIAECLTLYKEFQNFTKIKLSCCLSYTCGCYGLLSTPQKLLKTYLEVHLGMFGMAPSHTQVQNRLVVVVGSMVPVVVCMEVAEASDSEKLQRKSLKINSKEC